MERFYFMLFCIVTAMREAEWIISRKDRVEDFSKLSCGLHENLIFDELISEKETDYVSLESFIWYKWTNGRVDELIWRIVWFLLYDL